MVFIVVDMNLLRFNAFLLLTVLTNIKTLMSCPGYEAYFTTETGMTKSRYFMRIFYSMTDGFCRRHYKKECDCRSLVLPLKIGSREISHEIVITHRSPLSFKSRVRFRDEYFF